MSTVTSSALSVTAPRPYNWRVLAILAAAILMSAVAGLPFAYTLRGVRLDELAAQVAPTLAAVVVGIDVAIQWLLYTGLAESAFGWRGGSGSARRRSTIGPAGCPWPAVCARCCRRRHSAHLTMRSSRSLFQGTRA